MPFLAQRGAASGNYCCNGIPTRILNFLAKVIPKNWPQVWAATLFMGYQMGATLAVSGVSLPPILAILHPDLIQRMAVALIVVLSWRKLHPLTVVTLVLFLTLWSGIVRQSEIQSAGYQMAPAPWSFMERPNWCGRIVVRVTGWPIAAGGGHWRFPGIILAVAQGDGVGGCPKPGRLSGALFSTKDLPPQPGNVLAMQVSLRPPGRAALPGGFNDRSYLQGHGLQWRGYVEHAFMLGSGRDVLGNSMGPLQRIHKDLLAGIWEIFPPPEANIVGAVLLGCKSSLAREAARPFAVLGLAHLFALSGLHVGILLGVLLLPVGLLGLGPGFRFLMVMAVLPLYVVLAGGSGSVIRAVAMALVVLGGPWLGRKSDPLRQLSLIYILVIGCCPWQLLDVGVQLSFLAAAGILSVGRVTSGFKVPGPKPLPTLAAGLGVSLAAQWFTLPIVAGSFGFINPWAPVANLFFVPLFGLTVWFSVLGLITSSWAILSYPLTAWAIIGWRGLLLAIKPMSELGKSFAWGMMPPGIGSWLLWFFFSCFLLWLLQAVWAGKLAPLKGGMGLLILVGAGNYIMGPASHDLTPVRGPLAWQVDVDQGDCACLVFPDGWRVIIDTGGRFGRGGPEDSFWRRSMGPFLRRQGVRRIDLVILTHGHQDHTGGSISLSRNLRVDSWLCGGRASKPSGAQGPSVVLNPVAGQVLHQWGSWSLVLLQAPDPQDESWSENDHSLLVGLLRDNKVKMLWGGDQEVGAEKLFLNQNPDFGPVQIWKIGHHGSSTSGSAPFLARLHPQLSIISCGAGNKYNHPSHGPYITGTDTLTVVRTDENGSIQLRWAEDGSVRWKSMYGAYGSIRSP